MAKSSIVPLRDSLGNIMNGHVSYNTDQAIVRYCNTASNGDSWRITPIRGNCIGIVSTCSDLQFSATTAIASDPVATPATLLPDTEGRILVPSGMSDETHWYYLPSSVESLFFYVKRGGTFWACIMEVPDQFEDAQ